MRYRAALAALIATLGVPPCAQAQPPAFEVASIHKLPPPDFSTPPPPPPPPSGRGASAPGPGVSSIYSDAPFRISGNRVDLRGTLSRLVVAAYRVKEFQISGLPGWGASDAYEISAKAPGDAAPEAGQVRLMLQSLLAERFKLKLHRATKDLPVYHLVVAKNGPKLKDLPASSASSTGQPSALPIDVLIAAIAQAVDRPVLDKSGLTGSYDYVSPLVNPQLAITRGESPFTEVEQQLGLKLEPSKDATEFLIVEHVERPSDN